MIAAAKKGERDSGLKGYWKALVQVLSNGGSPPPAMIAAAKKGERDSGLKGYWKALVQFLLENVTNGNLEPFDVAVVYTYAGDADKALPWVEKAVEARCYGIIYLGVDPMFDVLRSDPRFVSLLRRINLPQSQ